MSINDVPPVLPLGYTIVSSSDHSGKYVAENILVDSPMDQGSRWSGAYQASNQKQWVVLKLDHLSILRTLTFGKFHKAHPCNMKDFKLYVGETEESMNKVLHGNLRNDNTAETFSIPHFNSAGVPFATRYVKIVPLSAHGQNFHTSIWHIRMTGIIDERYVQRARFEHEQYKESTILRHMLKHLRQRRFLGPYQNILSRTRSGQSSESQQFEHPTISSLHTSLVLRGEFPVAESLLMTCASAGLFTSSILSCQPVAFWSRIHVLGDADGCPIQPSARGGHSTCIDPDSGDIYMFGGWDGKKDLQDLWMWSAVEEKWKLLDSGGPVPRSCHKMVFNQRTGDIYLLGRLYEETPSDGTPSPINDARATTHGHRASASEPPPLDRPATSAGVSSTLYDVSRIMVTPITSTLSSDFYCYHTRWINAGEWELISPDTLVDNGPPLIFDHQMVMDNEQQIIYIFGGRIIDGDWDSVKCAGLYSYNIQTRRWRLYHSTDVIGVHPSIPARYGHSMVLDPQTQTLFIFAGRKDDRYLSDMYAYHIPTKTITELYDNFTAAGGPEACFTQRAVIDPELKEIYLFCGLTKGPHVTLNKGDVDAPYWVYRYQRPDRKGVWSKILPPEASPASQSSLANEPVARFAHQVVYDIRSKTVYMHGGNGNAVVEDEVVATAAPESRVEPRDEQREDMILEETRYRVMRGRSTMTENVDRGNETDASDDARTANRLDDFWSLKLQRPSTEEIIRRGKCLIRQQRFREMCEDATPVQALAYLQTEVSSVVDHSNLEETDIFRSLLSHLLTPPKPSSASTPPESVKGKGSARSSEDVPERAVYDEDEVMADAAELGTAETQEQNGVGGVLPVISLQEDPEERTLSGGHSSPSPERYKQRTEVFERLMQFVNEDARQPEEDLWDMIDVDQLEEQ